LLELKELGLIAQPVGSGTYVSEQAAAAIQSLTAAAPALQISPAVLMEARLALEPAIIDMVIVNATAADFEQMESCCAKAELAVSVEEFELWDGMLHELIAQAAHNSFVTNVFKLMNQAGARRMGHVEEAQPDAGAPRRLPDRAPRTCGGAQEPGSGAGQGVGERSSAARAT
jgi:DNA-binding FadR family transcriptional regulator